MDSLPTDILYNILSYIPGEDVERFNRLNSSFGEIIKVRRNYFKKPRIALETCESLDSKNYIQTISARSRKGHRREWSWSINLSKPSAIVLQADENNTCNELPSFVMPIFKGKQKLGNIFEVLFEGRDVAVKMMTPIKNKLYISALSSAIERTKCRILVIKVFLSSKNSTSTFKFLEEIAKRQGITSDCPKIVIVWSYPQLIEWDWLRKINALAPMFSTARLKIFDSDRSKTPLGILKREWLNDQFDCFSFEIKLRYYQNRRNTRAKCDIIVTVEEETNDLCFEDKQTKEMLEIKI